MRRKSATSPRWLRALTATGNRRVQEVQIEEYSQGLPRSGRDSILIMLRSRRAKALRRGRGSRGHCGAEYQRSLPLGVGGGAERMAARVVGSAQEEEAGKILAVAFDGAAQNVGAVDSAATALAIPAASVSPSSVTILTLPAVS